MGDFAILLRAGFSRWDAACAQIYTALAGILGAITALLFSASASAVGKLFYVGIYEICICSPVANVGAIDISKGFSFGCCRGPVPEC